MSCTRKRRMLFPYSMVNPILRFLVLQFGLGTSGDQDFLRILRVRGRKSGLIYEIPVRIAILNGQCYLMSMLGETQWVQNLRATNSAQLLAGKAAEQVRVNEIEGEEKAVFLNWYCKHPQYEQRARYGLKADTEHLTPIEIERLARLYPVFRLEGIFITDPVSGYPPGSPDILSNPTPHSALHDQISLLGFLALTTACFVFSYIFTTQGGRGWAMYSVLTGVLFPMGIILASMAFSQNISLVAFGG